MLKNLENLNLPVVEMFTSVQGEGSKVGIPTIFIRLAGCDVGCIGCDTEYSWCDPKFEVMSLEDIYTKCIRNYGYEWVSITGGEPLMHAKPVGELLYSLRKSGMFTHLETSGKYFDKRSWNNADVVSMDIKTPCTGVEDIADFKLFEHLGPEDNVKCLIDSWNDLQFAHMANEDLDGRCEMILQSYCSATDDASSLLVKYQELHEMFKQSIGGMDWNRVRILPQLHVLVWNGRHGR